MIEMECIVLDDGLEYFILENIELDGIIYVLFSNVNNEKDIKIRKVVIENEEQYYVGIDSDEEVKNVILAFNKKINS